MTAESIANALRGRRNGRGWSCRCPAHEDRSPSLSLTEREGRVLVHCHAGCDQQSVLAALRARSLWPDAERREWRLADRRQWQRDRDDARLAAWWGRAALMLAEAELEGLGPCDPERAAHTRLIQVIRAGGATLTEEFRSMRRRNARYTRALVRAGRESERRLRDGLAALLEE